MKTIDNIRQLEPYGIDLLTGEACGIGMRLLCDVTPEGEKLLSSLLGGITLTTTAWNGEHKSIMIPRSLFPDLCAYALLQDQDTFVVVTSPRRKPEPNCDNSPYSFASAYTREEWEQYKETFWTSYTCANCYTKSGTASDGMRNRHEFSGRVQ